MICDFCADILPQWRNGSIWGEHQANSEDALASVLGRCTFCSQLYGDLVAAELTDVSPWPIYRWTLRGPNRTKETDFLLVVTFRPQKAGSLLRDHIFYLYPEEGEDSDFLTSN
jgi:hypothetical protein